MGIFKSKPQVQVREIVRTVPFIPTAEQQKIDRVDSYIKKATDEYARLAVEAGEMLDQRDSGQAKVDHRSRLDRIHGQMSTLADTLSLLTGEDRIVLGFKLDKLGSTRKGEVFPLNSFLSSGSAIYPSNT